MRSSKGVEQIERSSNTKIKGGSIPGHAYLRIITKEKFDRAYESSNRNKQCDVCEVALEKSDKTIRRHTWDQLACYLCNCGQFSSTHEAINKHNGWLHPEQKQKVTGID